MQELRFHEVVSEVWHNEHKIETIFWEEKDLSGSIVNLHNY